MFKRSQLMFLGGCLFLLFVFFSFLVHKDVFTQFDFNTTVRLQDNIPRRFDDKFSLFSDIGKFEIMVITLIVIFVVARKFLAGVAALGLFAAFHIIELFGKFFVHHPPPPQFMLRTQHMIDFPQFHIRSESSYPSGHTGRAFFLAAILLVIIWQSKLSRPMKFGFSVLIGGYVAVMFISRPYLGEHWISDVIGGALLGGGLGLVAASLMISKKKHKAKKRVEEEVM